MSNDMGRRTFLALTAAASIGTATGVGAQAPPAKKYRACVIGDTEQGGYGHSLHMLCSLRDDIDVVGLADPNEAGRAKHAGECGAARTYSDYRKMLKQESPELVIIGPRWTTRHKEYLMACAEAGAHGIMEKPLTPDLAEADEVIAAMDAKQLKWAMAFNFRASPIVPHARKLIQNGLIGHLLEMRGRGKEDHRAGGEDLIVLGTHTFDLMTYFAGQPEWCEADVLTDGRPVTRADIREATEPLGPIIGDTIHATYGFPKGVRGYFSTVKNPDGNVGRWGLDLYGTQGVMTIRMGPVPDIRLMESPTWTASGTKTRWKRLPSVPRIEHEGPVGHYKPIVDDLIASIEEDRRPFTSLHSGREALEMVQGIFEASVNPGRHRLPLERRDHPLRG